jgi:hypothetical protein
MNNLCRSLARHRTPSTWIEVGISRGLRHISCHSSVVRRILRDCAWRHDRLSATNLSHADRGGRTVTGPRHAAGKCLRLPVTRIRADVSSATSKKGNGDPAPLKRGHESGRIGGDTPRGFGPPPRCARTPPLSAFSRTCCRADRARRSSSRPGVESRRSRASRVGSRAYRHPAVAAEELVAHGQIRVQDRANRRRARGVE